MANMTIKMVARDYDFLTPLIGGDVKPEGIELIIDRATLMAAFRTDESFQAGEMSFSQYVRRLDSGEDDVVGFPIFLMRGFRHRCFFTLRDNGLTSFEDLRGKRIGTNGWPDSGNTWSRSLIRAAGVSIDEIEWVVGPIDGIVDEAIGHRASSEGLPPNASVAPEGKTLAGMLQAGELDAMMVHWPPQIFYEQDSPVVRLLPDFQQAEEEYARKMGFCPTHHILGVRASVLENAPWIAGSLFRAFEESRKLAEERRWVLTDTSPWLLADLERTAQILGRNWQAHGVAGNEAVIDTFCAELHAQGITSKRIAGPDVFARFEELVSRA